MWLRLITLGLLAGGCVTPQGPEHGTPFVLAPTIQVDKNSPARLGEKIFRDTQLSSPPGQACQSCHEPAKAFTGNGGSSVDAVARGANGYSFGNRNVPTAMYAMFIPPFEFERDPDHPKQMVARGGLFLDGRASTMLEQAKGPLLNPKEMNNKTPADVIAKIRTRPYAAEFMALYGKDIFENPEEAFEKVAEALVAFESTPQFRPFSSPFDEYLRGKEQLTAQEQKGFELFTNPQKGNCIACHAGDVKSHNPEDWMFTDYSYDNLGVPRNRHIPDNERPQFFDLGLCAQPGLAAKLPSQVALKDLCGAFRVPTLRNIAKTSPYMHNGRFKTLTEAVRFYATREVKPAQWYPRKSGGGALLKYDDLPVQYHQNVNADEVPYDRRPGQDPRLNEQEIAAIVAFLETLTDR